MNISLTGSNGFVGKIIKAELENDGHTVIPARTDKGELPYNVNCIIHCARNHRNLEYPITHEKFIGEYETDVVFAYEFTMSMIERNPQINNIIFISSIYGIKLPTVRHIPINYCLAKAAENYLSKCLAVQLAPKVRVNCIILGGVSSDRTIAQQEDDFKARYSAKTLLGHMVQPDEIIGAVRFLISDASKGITASNIVIDGGYTVI